MNVTVQKSQTYKLNRFIRTAKISIINVSRNCAAHPAWTNPLTHQELIERNPRERRRGRRRRRKGEGHSGSEPVEPWKWIGFPRRRNQASVHEKNAIETTSIEVEIPRISISPRMKSIVNPITTIAGGTIDRTVIRSASVRMSRANTNIGVIGLLMSVKAPKTAILSGKGLMIIGRREKEVEIGFRLSESGRMNLEG